MKKFLFLQLVLFFIHTILTSSGGSATPPWAKENVSFPMMNQEIRHSMQENGRQKEMKKVQTTNTITENQNKNQWSKLKETSNKIQDRLRIVSFAMQAIPTGVVITREAERIKETQQRIINEINTAPYSLVVALPLQIQFVDDLQMVVRLLTGIVISYGAINQMEKSERKILLDYALQEVENLNRSSYFMLVKIKDIKEKIQWKKNVLEYYRNRDAQVVKDIIGGIKKY